MRRNHGIQVLQISFHGLLSRKARIPAVRRESCDLVWTLVSGSLDVTPVIQSRVSGLRALCGCAVAPEVPGLPEAGTKDT